MSGASGRSQRHQRRRNAIRSLSAVALFLFLFQSTGFTDPISSLVQDPSPIKETLGNSSHLTVTARRPAHARLLWVNFDWLAEHGIDIPAEGMTPEFEQQVMDTLARVIPDKNADPSDFAPGPDLTVDADLYGGAGISENFGSGRAASKGKVQYKFLGQTGLSANDGDFLHSYGRGPLSRSFSEAIWGEIGQDFPWSSNRVIAVFDRGSYTVWPDGQKEREGLLTREDPLRAAHFMFVQEERKPEHFSPEILQKLTQLEEGRKRTIWNKLPDALPHPKGMQQATLAAKVAIGFREYDDRLADQYGFAYANRFYHGATSPSNGELDGKLLDYDTMTSQPDYTNFQNKGNQGFSETNEIESDLIQAFAEDVRKYAPPEIGRNVPSSTALIERFREKFATAVQRSLVELTGAPRELVQSLGGTPESKRLGALLKQVASAGAKTFVFMDSMPTEGTAFDLPKILINLAFADPSDTNALNEAIKKDLPVAPLREALVKAYSGYVNLVQTQATKDGVAPASLRTFMLRTALIRNADTPDLYRPTIRSTNERLVDEYLRTQNRSLIWNSIDERVRKNRRVYRGDHPYQAVLGERKDPIHRTIARYVYDAKKGEYQIILRSELVGGKAYFFGNLLTSAEIASSLLKTSANGWAVETRASLQGGHVEFVIPATPPNGPIELALRSGDGTKWWKWGDRNIVLEFPKHYPIPNHAVPSESLLAGISSELIPQTESTAPPAVNQPAPPAQNKAAPAAPSEPHHKSLWQRCQDFLRLW